MNPITTPLLRLSPSVLREAALVTKRSQHGLSAAEQAELNAIYREVGTPGLTESEVDDLAATHDLPAWQVEVLQKEHELAVRDEAEAALQAQMKKWAQEERAAQAAEWRSEGRLLRKTG